MGKRRAPGGWCDPASDVQITVLQEPGEQSLWQRLPVRRGIRDLRRRHALGVVVVVVAATVGAIVAFTSLSSSVGPSAPRAHEGGASGVAAAYGYPTRCLSVTISSIDPAFARADFNHGSLCGRFAGDPTAVFHMVDREWRPVLKAVSYSCPAAGIPRAVQSELGVCAGTTRSRRPR